jgi:hypothetical protein
MQGATFFMGAGQKNPGLETGGNDTLFNVSERLAAQWTLRDAVAVCRERTSCRRQHRQGHVADLAGTDLKPDALKPESKPFARCDDALMRRAAARQ